MAPGTPSQGAIGFLAHGTGLPRLARPGGADCALVSAAFRPAGRRASRALFRGRAVTFGTGWVLAFLALLPIAAMLIGLRDGRASDARLPALQRVAITGGRVRPASDSAPRRARFLLAAITLAVVALARPLWGEREEPSFTQVREVMVALDLSRSMLTEDAAPSRLDVARSITEQLLDALEGESVGLIVFAGTAFVQVPLSPDYQIIREFLPNLNTDYLPQGGSNYTSMLDAALDGFSDADDRDRYLVVLSDGESSTSGWQERLDELVARGVRVLALGIGSRTGGFIADPIMGGYLAGSDGNPIRSRLMPATLQTLANRSRGRYLNASELTGEGSVRELLAETVEAGRRGRTEGAPTVANAERFQWFLLPAIVLALVALLREFPRQPRPRQVRSVSTPADDAGPSLRIALLAVLLLATNPLPQTADAHFDHAADFDVRVVISSDPPERVREIAAHLAEYGYDAFDLRLLVEESIRYGEDTIRTGEPIKSGVIRDAIEASLRGERLDDSIADWAFYRARLESMLRALEVDAADEDGDERPRTLMDEEDSRSVVSGQSTQQAANDSFGQGASSRTDATLGDLSPDQDITIAGRRKPPTPAGGSVRDREAEAAAARNDPILAFSRERLEAVISRDSPGRLHQLLLENPALQDSNEFEW
jgi:Ca-activated chloride channel family protein